MKIISLNTWHGTQKAELRNFLQSHIYSTDIFCLQETVGEAIEGILFDLFSPDDFDFIKTEKFITEDTHYCSHTFIKKPLNFISSHSLLDSKDPDTGAALATKIDTGGHTLSVVNLHGVPLPGHKLDTTGRLRQSKQILNWLKDSDLPTVICGDFNLLPEAKSLEQFTDAGYQSLIKKYNIATTRNRFAWDEHPIKQLFADYTFISPNLAVASFTVPDIEVSDHLPMIVDINL